MKIKTLTTHPIPDNLLDIVVDLKLSKAEILVYLYLLKHITRSAGADMHFTYDEIQFGSKFSEGVRNDKGTGLSHTSVKTAVASLEAKQLIKVTKEGEGTQRRYTYSMRFPGPKSGRSFPLFTKTLPYKQNKINPYSKFLPKDFAFLFIGDLSPTESKSLSLLFSLEGEDGDRKEITRRNNTPPIKDITPPLLRPSAKTTNTSPDEYTLAAKQLWKAVAAKGLLDSKSRVTKWVTDFRKHSQTHPKFKWTLFKKVLDWYCDGNIGKKYVPHAFSASSFCAKFGSIKLAMEDAMDKRDTDFHSPEHLPPNIEETPLTAEEEREAEAARNRALADKL